MAYWEWGEPENQRVLICVHGLTRCGQDFAEVATRLSPHYRVVCPDVVGRGRSDWLIDPMGYTVPQYISDMLTLIARLGATRVDWLGTSMGGLIGLGLIAALTSSDMLRPKRGDLGLGGDHTLEIGKLILNDIGPHLEGHGLARIADYVGKEVSFDTFEEAVTYIESVSAGFGPLSVAQWQRLTRDVFVLQNGRWVKHYDRRLAQALALQDEPAMAAAETLLWNAFEAHQAPILVLRGRASDVLSEESAQEMLARNSRAQLVEFAGVGHAPSLLPKEQIDPIEQFLLDLG